ncbi:hypothetical protein F5Y14DRAFT_459251 [Nemania sp. NC0429]|nr:hypothetical protein F5Y14DRAFT_459251 [Nemania sp. NC0429]
MDDFDQLSIVNTNDTQDEEHEAGVDDEVATPSNQIATLVVSQAPASRTARPSFEHMPPELWLETSEYLDARSAFRLSRVDKYLFSLLIPLRARYEALVCQRKGLRWPSMLSLALRQNWSFSEIDKIVSAYAALDSYLLVSQHQMSPPLHFALKQGRDDVAELLLRVGVTEDRVRTAIGIQMGSLSGFFQRNRMCFRRLDYLLSQGGRGLGIDQLANIINPTWIPQPVADPFSAENQIALSRLGVDLTELGSDLWLGTAGFPEQNTP